MRSLAALSCMILVGVALGGCNTGAPQGVLPRDPLPPPPSVSGRGAKAGASTRDAVQTGRQAGGPSRQRAIDVPDRMETPRPSSTTVAPVMTPSGAGAGFRF